MKQRVTVARDLGPDFITSMSRWATDGLEPDLVVVLDIDPVEGLTRVMSRGQTDRIERERLAFHERVRHGYRTLVAQRQETHRALVRQLRSAHEADTAWGSSVSTPWYVMLDASRPTETVAADIVHHVETVMLAKVVGRAS